MHTEKKPLFATASLALDRRTPTHAGCALIPLFFRRAKTQRARERGKKNGAIDLSCILYQFCPV